LSFPFRFILFISTLIAFTPTLFSIYILFHIASILTIVQKKLKDFKNISFKDTYENIIQDINFFVHNFHKEIILNISVIETSLSNVANWSLNEW